MLKDEIRLATLRARLEDRPNNKNATVQLGERESPTETLLGCLLVTAKKLQIPMPSNRNTYRNCSFIQ